MHGRMAHVPLSSVAYPMITHGPNLNKVFPQLSLIGFTQLCDQDYITGDAHIIVLLYILFSPVSHATAVVYLLHVNIHSQTYSPGNPLVIHMSCCLNLCQQSVTDDLGITHILHHLSL